MKADLHIHSDYSDGSYSVEELLGMFGNKLDLISITDHDNVDVCYYLENFENKDDFNNLEIIRGVELTTYYKECELHLLAYNFSKLDLLSDYLSDLKKDRVLRAREIVSRLNSNGIGINLNIEEIKNVGLPHIADALVDEGYCSSRKDAFKKYLYKGSIFNVRKKTYEFQDLLDIVSMVGGTSVLAHPGELDRSIWLDSEILKRVDGIEVYHPSNLGIEEILLRKAFEYKLLVTGGSDFHSKHDIHKVGNIYVDINRSDFFG